MYSVPLVLDSISAIYIHLKSPMSNYRVVMTPEAAWCGISKHCLVSTSYSKLPAFAL